MAHCSIDLLIIGALPDPGHVRHCCNLDHARVRLRLTVISRYPLDVVKTRV